MGDGVAVDKTEPEAVDTADDNPEDLEVDEAVLVEAAARCLTEMVGRIALEGCQASMFSSRNVRGSPERRQSAYTRPLRIRLISIRRWVSLPV